MYGLFVSSNGSVMKIRIIISVLAVCGFFGCSCLDLIDEPPVPKPESGQNEEKAEIPLILDPVPAQNASNPNREIDLGASAVLDNLYKLWDSLIADSEGYIQKTVLGKDGSNTYDIFKVRLTEKNNDIYRKKVFIMPNQHGIPYDPIDASWTCYYLSEMLVKNNKTNQVWSEIRQQFDITMVACCNPWGVVNRSYGTYTTDPNGYHINCNRNWDYDFIPNQVESTGKTSSGPSPFCIPETQYLMDIIENEDFDLVVDLHSYGNGTAGMKIFVASQENEWLAKGAEFMEYVSKMVEGVRYSIGVSETALNGKASPYLSLKKHISAFTLECACCSYGDKTTAYDSNPLTADLYALVAALRAL